MPLAHHDDYFDVADTKPMRLILVCRACGALVDVAYRVSHLARCGTARVPDDG